MKKKYLSVLCASVLAVIFSACKEDIGNLGLNVQPEDELLNTILFEETEIAAYSAKNDSVITSNIRMNLLGDIQDPIFGKTQAAIYTQFHLSGNSLNFKDSAYVDSLVLNLVYGAYYGDTLQSLRIRVYELNEDLLKSTVYYGNSTVSYKSDLLGEIQVLPTPNTPKDTSTKAAYMSIPLSKDFAKDKFLSKSGKSELENDANFIAYFKGFYIEAEAVSANGCMMSIDLIDSRSALNLYYGNKENSNQMEQFRIDTSCVRFSHINHFDYAGVDANLSAQLAGNHASTNDVLYGQSSGGIKTVIAFPHLKELFAGQQIIIHKAELVVTRIDDALPNYFAPASLSLSYDRSPTEKNLVLLDAYFGLTYFGGTYDEVKKQYAFRITKYIQELIDGENTADYRLNLMVVPAAAQLTRSMFYGTNPADKEKRIKLKIHYTLIK